MNPVLLVLLNFAIFIALCISVVQFWRGRKEGSKTIHELAALSSLLTLAIVVLLYSGEFMHQVLAALRALGASHSLRHALLVPLSHLDEFCTDVVNAINGFLGAGEVGHRPEPPLWPALLLALGYSVRFLIYRFHTRRGNLEAALTGAAYWSFITTYLMALAYLIVLAGFDPAPLIPISLFLLGILLVGVRVFFEDFGLTVRALAQTLWTEVSRTAAYIAYAATEIAAAVRALLSYANRLYIERVRRPLRQAIGSIEARNRRARHEAEKRLARQNDAHAKRFPRRAARENEPDV